MIPCIALTLILRMIGRDHRVTNDFKVGTRTQLYGVIGWLQIVALVAATSTVPMEVIISP